MNPLLQSYRNRLFLLNCQLRLNIQDTENTLVLARAKLNQQRRNASICTPERMRRRYWVKAWLLRRPNHGQYERLMHELRVDDEQSFRNFVRMDARMFHEILQRIEARIVKQDTFYRKALTPGLKLALTLRYLATGDSYHSLMYGFRVASNTISKFIPEVCNAIIEEYAPEVLACPTTPEAWKAVSDKFTQRWQFPHCLGALDGKHIRMKAPAGEGSNYFNYKGFHSVILLGLVDADYKFLWVDVGANGSSGDAQVFKNSELKAAIEDRSIGFPTADPLPGDDKNMPYFLVADDAFALREWLMKPFSKRHLTTEERIFNYRLSRARRIVENAFGILANRFRCLLTNLQQKPETVIAIVLACICLHNLMRAKYSGLQCIEMDQEDVDHNIIPGSWRQTNAHLIDAIGLHRGNTATQAAKFQRMYLTAYFNSDAGSVPWQQNMI